MSKVQSPTGTTEIPEELWPVHVKLTAGGATHWSSGPGNLTFDPSCPRCWFNTAHNLRAERDAAQAREKALREALRGVFLRHYEPQFGGYCWCHQRSGAYEPHMEYCKQAKAALAAAPTEPREQGRG